MASYSVSLGQHGFKRIADQLVHHADYQPNQDGNPGTDDASNKYYIDVRKFIAVLIVDAASTFDTGTVMAGQSDKPDAADSFSAGSLIWGPFSKLQFGASSVVYAYYD